MTGRILSQGPHRRLSSTLGVAPIDLCGFTLEAPELLSFDGCPPREDEQSSAPRERGLESEKDEDDANYKLKTWQNARQIGAFHKFGP